jgi:hypothetical protein
MQYIGSKCNEANFVQTSRKFENPRCVAAIVKGITIASCCVLRLTKHFELTWVYN